MFCSHRQSQAVTVIDRGQNGAREFRPQAEVPPHAEVLPPVRAVAAEGVVPLSGKRRPSARLQLTEAWRVVCQAARI